MKKFATRIVSISALVLVLLLMAAPARADEQTDAKAAIDQLDYDLGVWWENTEAMVGDLRTINSRWSDDNATFMVRMAKMTADDMAACMNALGNADAAIMAANDSRNAIVTADMSADLYLGLAHSNYDMADYTNALSNANYGAELLSNNSASFSAYSAAMYNAANYLAAAEAILANY